MIFIFLYRRFLTSLLFDKAHLLGNLMILINFFRAAILRSHIMSSHCWLVWWCWISKYSTLIVALHLILKCVLICSILNRTALLSNQLKKLLILFDYLLHLLLIISNFHYISVLNQIIIFILSVISKIIICFLIIFYVYLRSKSLFFW